MPHRRLRIAIDLGDIHFLETYRADACRGMLRYARSRGDWELLFNDHRLSLHGAFRRLGELPRRGVDGLLVCSWSQKKLAQARALSLPMVSISNEFPQQGIACVVSDDRAVGRLAAEHLLACGFRHLAFCGSPSVPWDAERYAGFRTEAEGRGHSVTLLESRHGSNARELRGSASRFRRSLIGLRKPVGLFCADDIHSSLALEVAREAGVRVPAELAIVGVDNNPLLCLGASPALSSVMPDAEEVGYRAAEILARLLAGRSSEPQPILVPPRGISVRGSSDVLVVEDSLVTAALAHVAASYRHAIGAGEVAAALGVSRRTLEVRFRKALGFTIGERLSQQRVSAARQLLAIPHLPIAEVAQRAGFRSTSYFCERFRIVTGMTPTEWREKERGNKR